MSSGKCINVFIPNSFVRMESFYALEVIRTKFAVQPEGRATV